MKTFSEKSSSKDTLTRNRQGTNHKQVPVKISVPAFRSIPLIQRKSLCPCDGGCPSCTSGETIQPKLTIGQPNDKYEQEADRVADQIMRMPEPEDSLVNGHSSLVQRKTGCVGPTCTEEEELIQTKPIGYQITPLDYVQRLEETVPEEEEEEPVQLKSATDKSPPVTAGLQSQIQSMRGGGQALPEFTRTFFESRFGLDFSQVRVHTGSKAADAAKSVNAKAFTTGKDIVFGAGQFSTGTTTGTHLLAHELTHVIQQRAEDNPYVIQRATLNTLSNYADYPPHGDIIACERGIWSPTTEDFIATINKGAYEKFDTFKGFISYLKGRGDRSITRMNLIGHGDPGIFGIKGNVVFNTGSVFFNQNAMLTENALNSLSTTDEMELRKKFANNAKIMFYACNVGKDKAGGAFICKMASTFGVETCAHSVKLKWCLKKNDNDKKCNAIYRGRVVLEGNDCYYAKKGLNHVGPNVCCDPPGTTPGRRYACVPSSYFMTPAYYQNTSGEEALPSGNLVGLKHGDGITYGTWGLRPRVERLQIKLIEQGAVLKTDGMFGNETGAALRQFQASMGLPEQEIVDPATAEALDRYGTEPGEPSPISRIEGLKLNDGITYGTWDRRPRVRELQTRLTASGFFCEVDGMFGSKTADALHGFQAVNGLPQRDIVDRDTADALEGRKRGGTVPQCPPGYVPVAAEA